MLVRNKVENLLIGDANLRNSDKELLLAYWETQGLYLTEAQKSKFFQCTPAESVTRARRMLRGEYPGNKAVEGERYTKFLEHRGAIPWLGEE